MKKQYLNPIIDIYTITTEHLLNSFLEDTNTAPEAPDDTEAGAKEGVFESMDEVDEVNFNKKNWL